MGDAAAESAIDERVGVCTRSLKGEDKSAFLRAVIAGEEVVLILIADGHDGNGASQVRSHR
eukprot:1195453-Prymnesium_polylepis.1